jgi:hypothetical protein
MEVSDMMLSRGRRKVNEIAEMIWGKINMECKDFRKETFTMMNY